MSTSNLEKFEHDQAIFYEGDASDCIYIVKKGTLSIRKRKGEDYIELARIYTNEVIGELAFFDRQPRSASAFALTDCELLKIPYESMDALWGKIPDYFQTIIRATAERLRKANDTIRRLQSKADIEASNLAESVPAPSAIAETSESDITVEPELDEKTKL